MELEVAVFKVCKQVCLHIASYVYLHNVVLAEYLVELVPSLNYMELRPPPCTH